MYPICLDISGGIREQRQNGALSPCVATVVVNNWENIPRQTNISIRAQTLLQGPRWWEELLLAKYSESGPAQLWPGLYRVVVSAGY